MGDEFQAHRSRLFNLAYRLLGSAAEAEDAVQDAYLRWNASDRAAIGSPAAWLAKVLTNLCLNRLTSSRARREEYVGPWLPEPILTDEPFETAEQRDSISMAFLVLLERLTPAERVVFVLREAFSYGYREIAHVLLRPVFGPFKVGRYVTGLAARFGGAHVRLTHADVNGDAAVLASLDGTLLGVFVFETDGERIFGMRTVVNPDRLSYLTGQLAHRKELSHSGGVAGS